MARPINQAGLDLIRGFETLRLDVYDDGYGYATVGYGHRTNLPIGARITRLEAEAMFDADVAVAATCVDEATRDVTLSDNRFAALTSLAFNIGTGNFLRSTLLKDLQAGDFAAVPAEDARWNHAGGRISLGLEHRRAAEITLWNRPDA